MPPLIQVSVDSRQLLNEEFVSPKPVIQIRIFDDDLPTARNDTSMIAIWLKKQCNGCTDRRMPLENAVGKNVGGRLYEILLQPALSPGKYLLTIQCRDKTGHSAHPYQIHLEVTDQNGPVSVTVSPNPSDQWFRFTIQNQAPLPADLELNIRNTLGTTVFRKLLHNPTGRNECFWIPAMHSPGIPAGLYHYTISPAEANPPPAFRVERMWGHLLYAP